MLILSCLSKIDLAGISCFFCLKAEISQIFWRQFFVFNTLNDSKKQASQILSIFFSLAEVSFLQLHWYEKIKLQWKKDSKS